MPAWLTRTLAVACGLTVANLYYCQPLLGLIGASLGGSPRSTSLIVTFTQLGYAVGLVLLVPLGDRLENRRLINTIMLATVAALLALAASPNLAFFAGVSLLIGLTSVVAQLLVPLAAQMAAPESRGQVVGQVMSGLLLGILLARAAAGLLAGYLGWRGVYLSAAGLMLAMNGVLRLVLPRRSPPARESYLELLASLVRIFCAEPRLRRRALYQSLMFGGFTLFWTGLTYLLSAKPFDYPESWIGLFSLLGAVGALAAPVAGRMGDRGWGRAATGVAFGLAALGFALTFLQTRLWALALGAILLDLGVQTTLVLGQQVIYSLRPEERNRLNTLYVAAFFLGGGLSSALAGVLYTQGGWPWVAGVGTALPLLGLLVWLTERPGD